MGWQGVLGAALLLFLLAAATAGPRLWPHDALALDARALLSPPCWTHPLGTDPYGRDTLARLLLGARRSLLITGTAVGLATLGGGTLGLLAGYFGGWLDAGIVGAVDVLLALPPLLLCIAVLAFVGAGESGGLREVVMALGFIYIGPLCRQTRAAVLAVRHEPYVEASRMLGAGPARILFLTLLPNAAGPLLVEVPVRLAQALLSESALSFLGLGTAPPAPSWGELLADGRRTLMLSPWGVVAPGLCIALAVLGCNLLGEGLLRGRSRN
jgi:peptide/nickel transport system permease protein